MIITAEKFAAWQPSSAGRLWLTSRLFAAYGVLWSIEIFSNETNADSEENIGQCHLLVGEEP